MYNRGPESLEIGLDYSGCNLVEIARVSWLMAFAVPLLSGFTGSLKITSLTSGTFVPHGKVSLGLVE
jgi:hypothetical protein